MKKPQVQPGKNGQCLIRASIKYGLEPNTFEVYMKTVGKSPFDGKHKSPGPKTLAFPISIPDSNSPVELEFVQGEGLLTKANGYYGCIGHPTHTAKYGIKGFNENLYMISFTAGRYTHNRIKSNLPIHLFTIKVVGVFPASLKLIDIPLGERYSIIDNFNKNYTFGSVLFYYTKQHSTTWMIPQHNNWITGIVLK